MVMQKEEAMDKSRDPAVQQMIAIYRAEKCRTSRLHGKIDLLFHQVRKCS